jgi:dephospho-CoA kinase
MLKVGITGGIGSGKTTISKSFECMGIPVFNADSEAKSLIDNAPDLKKRIKKFFGDDVYTEEGILDRPKFANIIFNDDKALAKANSLIHPRVKKAFLSWSKKHTDKPYAMVEAAILFESGFDDILDKVIVIACPFELRVKWLLERNNTTRDDIQNRMHNQWPEELKKGKADEIIYNDEQHLIIPQVLEIHQKLIQQNKEKK